MARRLARSGGKGFGRSKSELAKISQDIKEAAFNALRSGARTVLSDLYEASPAWQGEFRSRWYSQVEGRRKIFFTQNERFQRNPVVGVPRFKADIKRPFTIWLGNDAPHATIAMDLEPAVFVDVPRTSEKPVRRGRRNTDESGLGIRGDLTGTGPNRATAPLDWYTTYMNGGGFSSAFRQGSKAGFIRPVQK